MREHPSIEAKKSLGQHFLNNERIPKRMANAALVKKGDLVFEIGPGTGVLTKELLLRGASVVALEADTRAVDALIDRFPQEIKARKLTLVHGDVRELNLKKLGFKPKKYKVVSNIPYYLSGMLFRILLENEVYPSDLVFLVQREVAERIARDPKESILSLSVKVFGRPEYIETVKRGNFTPPPKVESAIIAVRDISHDNFKKVRQDAFFTLLHTAFKARRKQLFGNLSSIESREILTHIFSTLDIPLTIRAEDVPLEMWLKLSHTLFSTKNQEKST